MIIKFTIRLFWIGTFLGASFVIDSRTVFACGKACKGIGCLSYPRTISWVSRTYFLLDSISDFILREIKRRVDRSDPKYP